MNANRKQEGKPMAQPAYRLQIVQNDPTGHRLSHWLLVRVADGKPVAEFKADVAVAQGHLARANNR